MKREYIEKYLDSNFHKDVPLLELRSTDIYGNEYTEWDCMINDVYYSATFFKGKIHLCHSKGGYEEFKKEEITYTKFSELYKHLESLGPVQKMSEQQIEHIHLLNSLNQAESSFKEIANKAESPQKEIYEMFSEQLHSFGCEYVTKEDFANTQATKLTLAESLERMQKYLIEQARKAQEAIKKETQVVAEKTQEVIKRESELAVQRATQVKDATKKFIDNEKNVIANSIEEKRTSINNFLVRQNNNLTEAKRTVIDKVDNAIESVQKKMNEHYEKFKESYENFKEFAGRHAGEIVGIGLCASVVLVGAQFTPAQTKPVSLTLDYAPTDVFHDNDSWMHRNAEADLEQGREGYTISEEEFNKGKVVNNEPSISISRENETIVESKQPSAPVVENTVTHTEIGDVIDKTNDIENSYGITNEDIAVNSGQSVQEATKDAIEETGKVSAEVSEEIQKIEAKEEEKIVVNEEQNESLEQEVTRQESVQEEERF